MNGMESTLFLQSFGKPLPTLAPHFWFGKNVSINQIAGSEQWFSYPLAFLILFFRILPRWLPFHPGRWWCHTRVVYLPMAYIYGRRAVYPINQLIRDMREVSHPTVLPFRDSSPKTAVWCLILEDFSCSDVFCRKSMFPNMKLLNGKLNVGLYLQMILTRVTVSSINSPSVRSPLNLLPPVFILIQ